MLHQWLVWQATQTGNTPKHTGISLVDSSSSREFLETIGLADTKEQLLHQQIEHKQGGLSG